MSINSSINNLIGTFNDLQFDGDSNITDNNKLICIDTSNNRLGINTLDPSHAIHVLDLDENSPETIKVNTIEVNQIKLWDTSVQTYKLITLHAGGFIFNDV